MGDRNISQPCAAAALLTSGEDVQVSALMMASRQHEVLQKILEIEKSLRELCERKEMEKSLAVLFAQQNQLVDVTNSTSEQLRSLQSTNQSTRNDRDSKFHKGEAIRSVYLFGFSYMSGQLANEIFEVKLKQGGGVTLEPRVVRLVARFTEEHEAIGFQAARIFNRSKLYVVTQDGGYIIDTKTMSRCSSLPLTEGYKSTPIVVSAYDKLYCLETPTNLRLVPEPSFERYDPDQNIWEKMTSYPFYNDYDTRMDITGYAVCYGIILFSFGCQKEMNFDVIAFHISRNKWKRVKLHTSVYFPPFLGRAVVIGKTIYSLHWEEFIAFSFKTYKADDGSLVYYLSQQFRLQGLEIARPPLRFAWDRSEYLVHLGNLEFFHVNTGCCDADLPAQYFCITMFQIVVGEGGTNMLKTIHSADVEDSGLNLALCFTPECGDYEPEECVNQPSQEETSLDENLLFTEHWRKYKKEDMHRWYPYSAR
ncbi:hypothetical protein ACE6H2_017845 [Prunus campanulata]